MISTITLSFLFVATLTTMLPMVASFLLPTTTTTTDGPATTPVILTTIRPSLLRHFSPRKRILHSQQRGDGDSSTIETGADNTLNADPTTKLLVQEFVQHVQESIQDKSFLGLTLNGARTKKKSKTGKMMEDPYRGSIRQVQGRLIVLPSKKDESLLQLTIKYHGATDICQNMAVDQILQDLTQFVLEPPASEWGPEFIQPFQGGELKTLQTTWELKGLSPGAKAKLVSKKTKTAGILSGGDDSAILLGPQSHDRTKRVPLAETTDTTFLQALGLTKPGMSSKLRQCNKFVEIVSGLVTKKRTSEQTIRVVDMGCGRGYLTFALHSYLSEYYTNVKSVGIDVRPKLVAEISEIAKSLGGPFSSLAFETGTIEEIVEGTTFNSIFENNSQSKGNDDDKCLDILIALHACDTATDDALWSGIAQGADIIVVAPCCHKQVRSQVNAHIATTKDSHPMYDILKHGVYRERLSETVTDSLRALLLEQAGYKVQVFEFIGGEHTSKNVMITAVRSNNEKKVGSGDQVSERIHQLASFYGITQQKLAEWMEQSLGPDGAIKSPVANGHTKLIGTQMPSKMQ